MNLRKFRQLVLKAKNLVSTYNSGTHLSRLIDNFEEIESSRRFQPSDKKIDIKTSIKNHELMAKTFEPERQITVYILLDVSASQYHQNETLILSVLYLLFLAENSEDNICLISFNDKTDVLLPSTNYSVVQQKLSNIKFKGKSNFNSAIQHLLYLNPTDSLIFIISDFYFDIDHRTGNMIKSLVDNSVYSLILKEKNEVSGKSVIYDSENDSYIDANLSDINFSLHQENIKKMLSKMNCNPIYIDQRSTNPFIPLIRKFI